MRWLRLFLACQHLNSRKNLRECRDQIWFKFQASLCFVVFDVRCFHVTPKTSSRTPGVHVRQVEDHWYRKCRELRRLIYILASTACYSDRFALLQYFFMEWSSEQLHSYQATSSVSERGNVADLPDRGTNFGYNGNYLSTEKVAVISHSLCTNWLPIKIVFFFAYFL
jgi:hypothetical protein